MTSRTPRDTAPGPRPAPSRAMRVAVVPYDPSWPAAFAAEAEALRGALGDNLTALFHIGSTAVPGLAAKPVLDMLPVVRDLAALDRQSPALAALGYEGLGELGIPGRRYFRKGGANRSHQLHAFQYNDSAQITRHLAFRNYLRAHPGACAEYAALKRQLTARHPEDIEAYCDGKDAFVRQHEAQALLWHWQGLACLE